MKTLANLVGLVHGLITILIFIGAATIFIPAWKQWIPVAAACNLLVLSSQVPFKCRCPLTVLERKLRGDSNKYTPFLVTNAKRYFGWNLNPDLVVLICDAIFVLPVLVTLVKWGLPTHAW